MSAICERPRVRSEIFCSTPSASLSTPLRITSSGVSQRPSTVASKAAARPPATPVSSSLAALFSSSRAIRTRFWPTSASGAVAISVAKTKNLARSGKRTVALLPRPGADERGVARDAAGEAGGVARLDPHRVFARAPRSGGGRRRCRRVPPSPKSHCRRTPWPSGSLAPLASKTSVSLAAPTGVSRSGPASTTGGALTRTRAASVPTAHAEPLSSVTESSTSRAPGVSKRALDLRALEHHAVAEAPAPAGDPAVAVGGEAGVEGDAVAGADDAVRARPRPSGRG